MPYPRLYSTEIADQVRNTGEPPLKHLVYQGAVTSGFLKPQRWPSEGAGEPGCGCWPVQLEWQSSGCIFRQSRSPQTSPLRTCVLLSGPTFDQGVSDSIEMWERMHWSEASPASGVLQPGRGTKRVPLLARCSGRSDAGPHPGHSGTLHSHRFILFLPDFDKFSY